jgi:hypothetical protein
VSRTFDFADVDLRKSTSYLSKIETTKPESHDLSMVSNGPFGSSTAFHSWSSILDHLSACWWEHSRDVVSQDATVWHYSRTKNIKSGSMNSRMTQIQHKKLLKSVQWARRTVHLKSSTNRLGCLKFRKIWRGFRKSTSAKSKVRLTTQIQHKKLLKSVHWARRTVHLKSLTKSPSEKSRFWVLSKNHWKSMPI